MAQGQTKNPKFGGNGDNTDGGSAVLHHHHQQQQQIPQQQHGMDMSASAGSMDNRSMLGGHYGQQQQQEQHQPQAVETNFDVDGNVETKSISSVKSTGSGGQEAAMR